MYDSKFLNKKNNNRNSKNKFISFINKILVCFIIFLSLLILVKTRPKFKDKIYNIIFNNTFSFSTIHKWYNDKFGSILPIDDIVSDKSVKVFNEKLKYDDSSEYKDGVKLTVGNNYLVPVIESGTVVFIGEKEGYGNTIIVQQVNGIDLWYSNINSSSVKLYDYINAGSYLGEVSDKYLYLFFQKDGKFLNYKDYI